MLRRPALVGAATVLLVGLATWPAAATGGWGSVECDQNDHPGCELGAGSGSSSAGGKSDNPGHPARGHKKGSSGSTHAKPKDPNPDLNLADCSYQRSDYVPPPGVLQTGYSGARNDAMPAVYRPAPPAGAVPADGPKPGQPGAWYVYKCSADGVRDAFYRPPVWIPDAPRRPAQPAILPDPVELARAAYEQLRLPSPTVESSPAGEQLVGLPTWLWLDRGGWAPVSATASVPGVSVTAVARPVSVVWALGDGSTVTCSSPGVSYKPSAGPKSASPDCGHTYRASSGGRPGGAYAVTATVHWRVTWSGAGENGVFPDLTTVSDAAFRVAESQGLNDSS